MTFRHLASGSYPFSQPMPLTGIVDRALSTSFVAALPKDEQDRVRPQVESLIESDSLPADHAVIEFPYVAEMCLCGRQV